MISRIADALILILRVFRGWTGSFGIAIILLTLAIRVILHPLTRKSLKSMKVMQVLAPQMTALREKYRDDPRAMNIEMMSLYRAHNVNPFSGCLPQLIQLPVLYGIFAALRVPGLFAGHPGLFAEETFLGVGIGLVPSFYVIAHQPLLALYPLLVGAATYLQQFLTISDPQQARMFVFMPVMVAYFATNFQIGLSIYWIVSTLAYMAEYLLVVGRAKPSTAGPAPAAKATPPLLPQRPKGTKKR